MGFGILLPPANYCTSADHQEKRVFEDLEAIGPDMFNAWLDSIEPCQAQVGARHCVPISNSTNEPGQFPGWQIGPAGVWRPFRERANTILLFPFPSILRCPLHGRARLRKVRQM